MSKEDSSPISVLFLCPQGVPEVFAQIIEQQKDKKNYDFDEINCSGDMKDLIVNHDSASILFCIQTRDDLVQLLTLCKINAEKIRQGVLKVGGLNLTGSHKLDDVLKKSGVSDIFLDSISAKTLEYKLNFWAKGIRTNLKKIQSVVAGNFKFSENAGTSGAKEGQGKKAEAEKVNITTPLNFSSDCWLLQDAPEEPRKIMGHWIVDLVGPSPYAGRWVEVKGTQDSSDQFWEWSPLHEETFQFIEHQGCWTAQGKQPQFMWKSNSWKFMGASPALFFNVEGGEPLIRFSTTGNTLTIADDSKYAQAKKSLIFESFDPKIVQKKDTDNSKENLDNEEDEFNINNKLGEEAEENAEELELLAKKAADNIGDLKGDVNLGDIDPGLLKGDVRKQDLSGGALKGKIGKNNSNEMSPDDAEGIASQLSKRFSPLRGSFEKANDDIDGQLKSKGPSLLKPKSQVEELAEEIRKQKEAKKKNESGEFSPKAVEGVISGKFKTLKKDKAEGDDSPRDEAEEEIISTGKRQKLRSERDSEAPDFSSSKLDIEIEKNKKKLKLAEIMGKDATEENETTSEDEEENKNNDKTALKLVSSPLAKKNKDPQDNEEARQKRSHSGIDSGAKNSKDLSGRSAGNKEEDEQELAKRSGIGFGNKPGFGGKGSTDKLKKGPLSGSGASDKIDEDPLAGSQDGADKLNKFLHGKTAWKDELGGHLRLTKLEINLEMFLAGSSQALPVLLGDVVDNLLVLYCERNAVEYDQKAKVHITCKYGMMDLDFSVQGTVVDAYENDETSDCCNLELFDYSEENLKQLKRLFGDRQKNITNFFIQAKGIVS